MYHKDSVSKLQIRAEDNTMINSISVILIWIEINSNKNFKIYQASCQLYTST